VGSTVGIENMVAFEGLRVGSCECVEGFVGSAAVGLVLKSLVVPVGVTEPIAEGANEGRLAIPAVGSVVGSNVSVITEFELGASVGIKVTGKSLLLSSVGAEEGSIAIGAALGP